MPKITYIDSSGTARTIDAEVGSTVMEAAIRNNIPMIEAECGGACACATCHVYVDEAWRAKTGEPTPMEEDMLDFGYDVRPNSRLSCQIKRSEEHTSELQSHSDLVCRLLLEKKKSRMAQSQPGHNRATDSA